MAIVTRAAHASSVSTLLANNTGGNISAADLRSVITDLEDSVVWNDEQNLTSVNGNTGVVVLNADDIDDTSTTNKFVSAADISKLAGIEASADVTDAANVETAIEAITYTSVTPTSGDGFLVIDTTDGGLKTVDYDNLPGAGGGLSNVVEDTTPQLGGSLDAQGNTITSVGPIFINEQAAANADVVGDGQLWVRNDNPNVLMFTDDAGTDAEVITSNSGTTLTSTVSAGGDSIPFFDVSDSDNAKQTTITNLISDNSLAVLGANTFTGTQDFNGQQVEGMLNKVVASVTGTLTTAAHSGNILATSGNVTIPTTAGFNCVLIAGGAHTVTFNATTSAAMATGDLMTIVVEDSTTIHAVLTAAADKVTFS